MTIEDPAFCWIDNPMRRVCPMHAATETLWYLSGQEDLATVSRHAPSYSRYSDDGATLFGAYGPRMHSYGQFTKVLDLLKSDPDTRQAVITISRAYDRSHSSRDQPCTCLLQFQVQDDRLFCTVYMRSNDLWFGFPYDVFAFMFIQRLVADHLGYALGEYTHVVGNAHLYATHYEKALDAIAHVRDRTSFPAWQLYPNWVGNVMTAQLDIASHALNNSEARGPDYIPLADLCELSHGRVPKYSQVLRDAHSLRRSS